MPCSWRTSWLELDPSKVRTVAYVPNEARSDAAIVALACDQLVVHPRRVSGRAGGARADAPTRSKTRVQVIRGLAPRKGRSWSLMAAMIDPHLDRLSRHAAGRRGVLLRRGAGRAAGAGQVGRKGDRSPCRQAAATRRKKAARVPPGQPRRRQFRPIQAVLRAGERSDAGRARLGRLADPARWPRRAWPCCCC